MLGAGCDVLSEWSVFVSMFIVDCLLGPNAMGSGTWMDHYSGTAHSVPVISTIVLNTV